MYFTWHNSISEWFAPCRQVMNEFTYPFKPRRHFKEQIVDITATHVNTVIHPDTPNFFAMTKQKYTAVLDNGCWEWTGRSLRHYQDLFNGFKVERGMYFNGGFQIVNESHKEFFDEVLEFYFENSDILREKQKAGLSTDQTPINYLIQQKGIKVKLLPQTYNLHHMVSKNLLNFGNSWWGDGMENLYEQAWVYHFNAIPTNPLDRNASYFIKRAYEELYENTISK